MKMLVTGGAGFIGANFLHYWFEHYPNDEVWCLDVMTYAANLRSIEALMEKPNFHFIQGDVADAEFVNALFDEARFDTVVHFAAESHVDRSIVDPTAFLRTNVLGTQVLLDAAKRYGVSRFHQVSTDEVYGDWPFGSSETFVETSPLKPSSPYAASKASADLLVLSYHRTFGLPVTISRCSNNYGPYQYPEKLIPAMVFHAMNDESLPVYGSGLNVRDWLYVEDHCRAIDVILQKGTVGEIYNVGTNEEFTNLDVIKTLLKQLGKPEELIKHVADRLGHDRRYATNADKLKALGWSAQHRFEEAFAHTVQWYVEHQDYWD
ncbi:MAG: dTDP-glucose 4,6-dehydratase [Burkholderiaceae bacterium]|nr:dTDP-glucose 4,6-dehydratase [Burkholderiaceae bacterium]